MFKSYQVNKKKVKKADIIDPEKAKEEIAELEGLIEKATVTQDLHSAAAVSDDILDAGEDPDWDEEMAKRRRRSNSYEDTIKNMDPGSVQQSHLSHLNLGFSVSICRNFISICISIFNFEGVSNGK